MQFTFLSKCSVFIVQDLHTSVIIITNLILAGWIHVTSIVTHSDVDKAMVTVDLLSILDFCKKKTTQHLDLDLMHCTENRSTLNRCWTDLSAVRRLENITHYNVDPDQLHIKIAAWGSALFAWKVCKKRSITFKSF